jgi:uncharacterized membrane protein YfcA
MELVQKMHDNESYIRTAVAIAVIAVCLAAIFRVPSMNVRGPSQLSLPAREFPVFLVIMIGFAIGCYGTIVGIGGGPLIVPVLVLAYGWENELLVATSLFVVFLNALSGSAGYALQRRIDYRGGMRFALAALPGAVISGFVHHIFNIQVFDIIFGIFLILLATYSLLSVRRIDDSRTGCNSAKMAGLRRVSFVDSFDKKFEFFSNDILGITMNFFLGFFVGFLGIGGGVFQVPILLFLLRYPPHIATATSHFITMLTCLFALLPHLLLGNIVFASAIWMGLGVVIGAQAGARLAPKISSRFIIYLFVLVLFVFAVKMFM